MITYLLKEMRKDFSLYYEAKSEAIEYKSDPLKNGYINLEKVEQSCFRNMLPAKKQQKWQIKAINNIQWIK